MSWSHALSGRRRDRTCDAGWAGVLVDGRRAIRWNNFYTRHFKPALRRAGLDEKVRFRDLRYSAASIAIATGANLKQVQQMLGHAPATVTLDTYSHVFASLPSSSSFSGETNGRLRGTPYGVVVDELEFHGCHSGEPP